jgi:hypothetical protein
VPFHEIAGRRPTYAARRKRKLEEYRARLDGDGDKTSRNVRARREPPAPDVDFDPFDSDSDDSDDSEAADIDTTNTNATAATATATDEDTEANLFKETVGYSVIESYVNGLTELWRDQRRSKECPNPHEVLRGKDLTSVLTTARQADWARRRAEHVDRALFTVVDGYDPPKMKAAISWCWREGSAARNGPEPYLRTAADFLLG